MTERINSFFSFFLIGSPQVYPPSAQIQDLVLLRIKATAFEMALISDQRKCDEVANENCFVKWEKC